MNGSLILGRIVIGGNFGGNSLQGKSWFMVCLKANMMEKLSSIAIAAPKPIMAWVTASTERDCQKKWFYLRRMHLHYLQSCTTTCKVSSLLAKFHHYLQSFLCILDCTHLHFSTAIVDFEVCRVCIVGGVQLGRARFSPSIGLFSPQYCASFILHFTSQCAGCN